jgi:hypothetical protein
VADDLLDHRLSSPHGARLFDLGGVVGGGSIAHSGFFLSAFVCTEKVILWLGLESAASECRNFHCESAGSFFAMNSKKMRVRWG